MPKPAVRRTRPARLTALVTVGTLAITSLVSCDSEPSPEDPEGASKLVAQALSRGDLKGAPVSSETATAELGTATNGLKAGKPQVTVASVKDGATKIDKTATLHYQWNLPSGLKWSYDAKAQLRQQGDKWTLLWDPTVLHPDLKPREQLRVELRKPQRANVLDRSGTAIVQPRPVLEIGIDKSQLPPANATTSPTALAKLVEIDPAAYTKSVAANGPKAFVQAIVLRAPEVDPALKATLKAIPGSRVIETTKPLAPSATFARPVLGRVGEATAEIVSQSKGRVAAGDTVGLSGLQKKHDASLQGRMSYAVRAVLPGAQGPEATRDLYVAPVQNGTPLRTTLDTTLQTKAEALLARFPKVPSSIVAIQPSTGAVLAAASGPGSKGYDTARDGRYAPGSTFKVVSALALLRGGQTIDGKVDCTPTIASNGRRFKNFPDYPSNKLGQVSFKTAVANSCNTVMIRGASKADQPSLATAADSLGMTQDLGDDAYSGNVPTSDTGAAHDASMIGQGRLLASPLGMAVAASSVVAGHRVTPYVVAADKPEPQAPSKPLTENEAKDLRDLMRAVVTEGGATGLKDLPGKPVLAKTGTAEYGTKNPPSVHSWMIAAQGDLAVAVFVEDGQYGGVTCLPVMKEFLQSAQSD